MLVGVACLALYAALAPAVPGDKDSGEFTLVLATLGLAHPTGYPLYTFAGHVFVSALHALGFGWAHAANLFSALGGAVAMGALHALTSRLLARAGLRGAPGTAGLALVPVLALAANPMWTQEATLAEVNAWHLAWAMLAALAAMRVAAALDSERDAGHPAPSPAALWGFVAGAGFAHHATAILFVTPLSLALLIVGSRRRRLGPATVAAFALGAALPLTALGYVAWRAWHPAAAQWPELAPSWDAVGAHLSGTQFRVFLGRFAPSPIQQERLARWIFPWLVPAALGALGAWRPPASSATAVRHALGAAVLLQCGYASLYGVSDPAPYFLPAIALGLALFTCGAASLAQGRLGAGALAPGLLVLALATALPGLATARQRGDSLATFDDLLRRMWNSLPPGPGFVVWDDDMASRLRGFQQLEGSRADLIVVQPRHLSHAAPRAAFRAAHGFDPLAQLPPEAAAPLPGAAGDAAARRGVESITATINTSSPLPVYVLHPEIPSLRRLTKPSADSSAVTGAATTR